MAQANFCEYLKGERIRTKKYFYVLRLPLAIQWLEKGYRVAPTSFGARAERMVTDPSLLSAIQTLIEQKRQGVELDDGPRIAVISEFIESELARLEQGISASPNHPPTTELDALLRFALEAA